ncbi:DNA-binding transcriptional regulator, MarR family [Terrimicrobium sacchariphilum]|jgi:DNA-binding MarR family transcriptional regulator|uniref:DNA-binding transcriptional regulator, MarR family n=1 Tax=Terrimicrobium sacchariphilum TaxID=690879 RepID=A0A146G738_TERSA|nr:MarR family transcriptional regulator [Terrimicrobium sacchariphilum]GAT32717.1 DNA-binding transcriptional regulator, MarR family [Terrimicrobium sacchariphilum]
MRRTSLDNVNRKPLSEAEQVFESIHYLMHLFRSGMYRVLRDGPYKLTHLEGKLLGYFSRHPGSTLGDLAEETGKDKGQLARLIRSLKEQGLLASVEDDTDRRKVKLALTPQGEKIHQMLRKEVSRLSEIAIQGLDAGQRQYLLARLNRIQSNLEESFRGDS